jgi:hypothetical protein
LLLGVSAALPESHQTTARKQIMADPKYKAFTALDPFFDIVQRGLAGHVDGDHYFDIIADNAVFEYRYSFQRRQESGTGRAIYLMCVVARRNRDDSSHSR